MQQTKIETKGPKRISVEELEKLEVPYGRSKILDAYKKGGFLDKRDESILERNWQRFFYPLATAQQKDRPRPITQQVNGMYRLKHLNKEYIIFHSSWKSTSWKKNPIDFNQLMGRYDIPEFQHEIDPNTNEIVEGKTQISGHTRFYDIPFTKETAKSLIEIGREGMDFIVIDSHGRKYSCSMNEYINDSYDELIDRKSGFAEYMANRDRNRNVQRQ
jgi:hypothetical protein